MIQNPNDRLIKRGTLDYGVSETTPFVFRNRLYRFEYINRFYHESCLPDSYFRILDVEANNYSEPFGIGCHLGTAIVLDDRVVVGGLDGPWGVDRMVFFESKDLVNWEVRGRWHLPGQKLFNNSMCRADDRFVMSLELAHPRTPENPQYSLYHFESPDLVNWQPIAGSGRYRDPAIEDPTIQPGHTCCPAIRFVDGYFYIWYNTCRKHNKAEYPENYYVKRLSRTRDFAEWEDSPFNPVLIPSPEDRELHPRHRLNPAQQTRVKISPLWNASDLDLCEFNGRVIYNYSWGSQQAIEYLATAEWDGTLAELVAAYFPPSMQPFTKSLASKKQPLP